MVLTLVAVTGGGVAVARKGTSPSTGGDAASGPSTSPGTPTAIPTPARAPGPQDRRPTGLSIPVIGVATSLIGLGLNTDETVEVPTDPDEAGWYRLGPEPGSPGSAVILGHVDSTQGPAVFSRLHTLAPGAQIEVGHADGSTSLFEVRTITTYANEDFPAADVYRNRGAPTLTLVTCGGDYDKAQGGYQSNVVVTAAYVSAGSSGVG